MPARIADQSAEVIAAGRAPIGATQLPAPRAAPLSSCSLPQVAPAPRCLAKHALRTHSPAMAALAPAAAEGLVASLARAQAELDWIRLRLEEEFARSCRKGEINTLALLTRLNKLRRCDRRAGRAARRRKRTLYMRFICFPSPAAAASCRRSRRSAAGCYRPSRRWWTR